MYYWGRALSWRGLGPVLSHLKSGLLGASVIPESKSSVYMTGSGHIVMGESKISEPQIAQN